MKHKHNYLDHTILENLKNREIKIHKLLRELNIFDFLLRIFNLSLIQLKILYKLCYYTL